MTGAFSYKIIFKAALWICFIFTGLQLSAQIGPPSSEGDTIPPMPSYEERSKKMGAK